MDIPRSFFCCHCGEDFADLGLDDNEVVHDPEHPGRAYCCEDCLHDTQNELWENRAYSQIPPDYND